MPNVYDTRIPHRIVQATAWLPSRPAERVAEHVWMSRSNSYPYLVASDSGDLVINTGMGYQGARHRERFEAAIGRALDVRAVVLTQSHPDHVGGLGAFAQPGTETIAQRRVPQTIAERRRLAPYINLRPTARMFARRPVDGEPQQAEPPMKWDVADLELSTLVDDAYAFEVGGRRYEAISVPGGETLDGLAVWLAEERTAWTGNLTGALYGALPHLSTIRGDRPRSAMRFVESVQRVLDLEPELLLTGHDEPIRGAERIQRELGKVVAAVRFIHDETIDGMNAGLGLSELMAGIVLPVELRPDTGRGPVSWCVRAVWEEYTGWFHAESLTELYPVPQRAIWPELAELAGGADALAGRARARVDAGEPVEALHYTDLALGVNPGHAGARGARIAALEELLRRSNNEAYDEARLLELELDRERALLSEAPHNGQPC
jgi:glyoxylase-like metal-dependent hydrolase (beta-lactamase superfamily II)